MRAFRTSISFIILVAALACTRNEEIFQPQSFDDLPGHTMALVEGSAQAEFAERHLRDRDVPTSFSPIC